MKDFFKLRESMTDFTNRDYKPGATDQEKRNAIKRKRADVEEGTWAIPETPKQKKELKNILKKPLPAGKDGDNASDKMYGIIGDDELFDDFYLAGKKNPKTDVRPLIKKAMKRLGIKEEVEEGKVGTPGSLDKVEAQIKKLEDMAKKAKDDGDPQKANQIQSSDEMTELLRKKNKLKQNESVEEANETESNMFTRIMQLAGVHKVTEDDINFGMDCFRKALNKLS